MKTTIQELDRTIARLKESIERVTLSSKFTNADRKTLLPYYADLLQRNIDARNRATAKITVFAEVLKGSKASNAFYAEKREQQATPTPPDRNLQRC